MTTTPVLRRAAVVVAGFLSLALSATGVRAASYALSFDGSSQFVSLSSGTVFYGDFTIEAWVYPRAFNSGARVLEFGNSGSVDNVALGLANTNNGVPFLLVYNNTTSSTLTCPFSLPSNQWTHVAATLSGTTGRLYTNGQLVATGTLQAPRAVTRGLNCFARRNTTASGFANAIIDEVRIWNIACPQVQIQTNMFTPSQLVSMPWIVWDFNEGTGTTAHSSGGESLPGALQNGPAWITPGMPSAPSLGSTWVHLDSPSTATLSGLVNPGGLLTTSWFTWGTSGHYTNTAPTQLSPGTSFATNIASIGPLTSGTTYSWWLIATNAAGSTSSLQQTFSTPSANASLSGLALSAGSLSPAFAPAVTNYSSTVTNLAAISVTPTAADTNASVQVRINGGPFTNVLSGAPSPPLPLQVGTNTLDVKVTAQDGLTTRIYTIALVNYGPPVILLSPANAQVPVGSAASFVVVASGSPTPAFQWLFNGANIAGATASSLTIPAAQFSDSGNYSVVLNNFLGAAISSNAALNVIPLQASGASAIQIRPGLNLIAHQLYQGGNTLNEIMPVVPDGTVVSKYDNTNAAWIDSAYHAALGAWVPGGITLSPGEGAFLDSPTNFTLTFNGTPQTPVLPVAIPYGTLWLLSRQTNAVGTYENIVGTPPSTGAVVYKWSNSNAVYIVYTYTNSGWSGGVAPIAAVGESMWFGRGAGGPGSVPVAPLITNQPVSVTVTQGASATFTVGASGTPPLHYQWYLNGNILPGATGTALTLTGLQPGDAGNYTVAVNNSIGTVESLTAALGFSDLTALPFADSFAAAGNLGSATNGTGLGSNIGASIEPGEPDPAFIPGGASVWLQWQPQVNGIVTFTTEGSRFNAMLAAYTGSSVSNLTSIAADDGSAGFLTSVISFNARAGTNYFIQVDGFYGETGSIVLSWNFVPTSYPVPVILAQSPSQTVSPGSNVTLYVTVQAGPPFNYQWFRGSVAVAGATNSTLTLSNLSSAYVGFYTVRVTNPQNGASVVSIPVSIEIITGTGETADVHPSDKFRSATDLSMANTNNPYDPAAASGYTGTQTFSSAGAGAQPGEPAHCGYAAAHSVWFSYQAPNNGLLTIRISGNSFNAVLAVYTGPGTSFDTLVPVACSANHGTAGESVTFTATSGTIYWIVVDGVGGASGPFTLGYNLVSPPSFTLLPVSQALAPGASATLTIAATGAPVLGYQWKHCGTNLPGATGSSYPLLNFQAAAQGDYTVIATNSSGTSVCLAASLYLNDPPRFVNMDQYGSDLFCQLVGVANTSYILLVSSNLVDWVPLQTNSSPVGIITYTDRINPVTAHRFYRTKTR